MTPEEIKALIAGELKTAVSTLLADAVKPVTDAIGELQKNHKVLADTLAADAAKPGQTKPADAAKALSAEDVTTLITEQLKTATASAAQVDARKTFLAEKLKDLPAAYQAQLGSDASKWAAEEQAIRTQYQADFKAAGGKPANVGGGGAGDGVTKPADTLDLSKLSPTQLIAQGLRSSTPVGPRVAGGATAATTATA